MRSRFWLPAIFALLACGDAPSAPVKTPFTIWVLEERLGLEPEERPLANATVAIDSKDGTRSTTTTDAEGRARVDLDFSAGGVMVTAFTAEHTVVTALDASPETAQRRPDPHGKPLGDLVVLLPRLDRALRDRSVALRGEIKGKREATNTLSLTTSLPRIGSVTTAEATYELRTPRDRPFFVLGHELSLRQDDFLVPNEHVRSFRIERPATASDATLDIDVQAAPPVTTHPVSLTVELPTTAPFGAGTKASAFVRSLDSQLLVGAHVTSRGSVVKMVVADTDVQGERLVTRVVVRGPTDAVTTKSELGVMTDGATVKDFLMPVTPPDDTNRKLTDPITLGDFPADADLAINVFAGDQIFWIVRGPPGGLREKTITLPEPAGIQFSTDVQLVALSIEARAERIALTPHGELYKRVAIAPDVVVRRQ